MIPSFAPFIFSPFLLARGLLLISVWRRLQLVRVSREHGAYNAGNFDVQATAISIYAASAARGISTKHRGSARVVDLDQSRVLSSKHLILYLLFGHFLSNKR